MQYINKPLDVAFTFGNGGSGSFELQAPGN